MNDKSNDSFIAALSLLFISGTQYMAIVFGDGASDALSGTRRDDILFGLGGNDTLFASAGDDILSGGTGFDTANYQRLRQKVTLKAQGVIEKGERGDSTDQIQSIEQIVGATGQRNLIDGTVSGGGPVSFRVNLSQNDLRVVGIPGIGSASFKVRNFVDVNGTVNSDTIVGNNSKNIFGGSRGNDFIDGGNSKDTVDYSGLGTAITLQRAGVVDKGGAGRDQLRSVETIIGAEDFENTIEGNGPGSSGVTAFNVNLGRNLLTVKNIPRIGNAQFTVKNFTRVFGTVNNDSITGDDDDNTLSGSAGNDRLFGKGGDDFLISGTGNDNIIGGKGNDQMVGGDGNDSLRGGSGNDFLIGVNLLAARPGMRDRDRLLGGQGADTFVLGNSDGTFYASNGDRDFATIADFKSGFDKIVLSTSGSYSTDASRKKIFLQEANGGFDLIAKTNSTFNSDSDFLFI